MHERTAAFRIINGIPFYHSSREASRDGKIIYGKGFDEDALLIAQTPFAVTWRELFNDFNTSNLEEVLARTYGAALANIPHFHCLSEIIQKYQDSYIITPPYKLVRKNTACIATNKETVLLVDSPDELKKGDYASINLIMPIPFTIIPYEEKQD